MTLWLDDLRDPVENGFVGATWVKTAEAAIKALRTKRYRFASLDHDLSVEATMGFPTPDEETGYGVILWLQQHPEYWPARGVRVHSLNPAGKRRMLTWIRMHYGCEFE